MRYLLVLSLFVTTISLAGETDSLSLSALPDTTRAYPIVLDGDTLFHIRTGVFGFPAAVRATAITDRLRAYADDFIPSDSVATLATENGTQIVAGERLLLVVADADAAAAGIARERLASEYAEKIRSAVRK